MPTTFWTSFWWVIVGFLPSLVWLLFFLHKDSHPEPRAMLIKTFLMGIILSPLAIVFQLFAVQVWSIVFGDMPQLVQQISWVVLWAAFVEESVKFLAVRFTVLRDPAFDEPVDGMIYLITAALGFAAMENILVLFKVLQDPLVANPVNLALSTLLLRFTGATLLHALSSALVGYFLALAWFFQHHRAKLIWVGIILATVFHFAFNEFINSPTAGQGKEFAALAWTTALLVLMAFLVSILFDKIKERHAKETVRSA